MIVIFCFSSIPSKAMPNFGLIDFLVKKGGHALGFGLLALSYYYGYTGNWFEWKPLRAISALILAALFAVTDEYHQSFVPGRQPSVTDIMIDVVGSGVALIAAMWCIRKK
jgi:VanZ family protein